ncbi:hypothetical protein Tco_0069850, partial [Tanacetum coccineum]
CDDDGVVIRWWSGMVVIKWWHGGDECYDDDGVEGVVVRGDGIGGSDGVMMIIMGVRWRWCYGGGDRVARGGEWYGGLDRSGYEEYIWSWPEYPPENFSGGGVMVAGEILGKKGRER